MKRNALWLSVVVLALIGSLEAFGCNASSAGAEAQPPSAKAATSVLLLANMAEADASCGCGEIIRLVRAAARDGVRTREVDARNKDEAAKVVQKYRVTVQPTVLLLDEAGRDVKRFEGESNDTIRALMHELSKLVKRKK